MPIYGTRRYVFLYIPYIPQELAPADGAAAVLDKVVQDAKLQGRELQLYTILRSGMATEIDVQVIKDIMIKFFFVIVLATFDNNPATRSEFIFAKGFRYVVVGAQVEPF